MAWHSKPDEAVQNEWQVRSAKKRDELSRSIEETLADGVLGEEPFADEMEEPFQSSKNSMIIPPKLSLQSKQMPAVHIKSEDVTSVSSVSARITTDSVAVPPTTQKKRRLAGRSTKIQLQAVPKTEKKAGAEIAIEEEKNSPDSYSERRINGKSNTKRPGSSERGAGAKGKIETVESGIASRLWLHKARSEGCNDNESPCVFVECCNCYSCRRSWPSSCKVYFLAPSDWIYLAF